MEWELALLQRITSIAKRICDLADPGEVLVSRTVSDLAAGTGITFENCGDHMLKGVPGT